MKKIEYMDASFRDGFQSCIGARARTEDFLPALAAAKEAGTTNFEIGGGARFQSLYFYCQEDAFEMMDKCREVVGPQINLQTLSRGANVVGLISQSTDIINLHAVLFKKHGVSTIRNFDALNDVRNLAVSGRCIANAGLKHQVTVTMMGLSPSLKEEYAHTPKFYTDKLRAILDDGLPFDSLAFKDASGTSTPQTVYETIKAARALIGDQIKIQFHTHDTAGMAVACNFAAIEAGADIIDLAMSPMSGGTCEADILVMWQRLRGTDYTLDIDPEKILQAERVFEKQMAKYFIPPESMEVSPKIIFSPMPGGALTANTQMMRDNNCLDKFPAAIDEMRDVVAKGGFGTSVTPVSQFYFQQAFANVMQGKWKKITDGYGKMVLGYFGRTPVAPDPEIVKLAAEQLKLEPTTEDVHAINDRNPKLGIKAATARLEAAGIPVTDENVFIVATCDDKGLEFLKGNKPCGIRYKEEPKKASGKGASGTYTAAVDGKNISVDVQCGDVYTATVNGKKYSVKISEGAAPAAAAGAAKAASGAATDVVAPLPGTVTKLVAAVGSELAEGDTILVIEAMKMETPITAEKACKLVAIPVTQGQVVAAGDTLAQIEEN
ncbi:MAG: biotin/lipoyl-binding protein [Victivallaceae bacterium]|nr:biotin/lipoyl-binding protein [Victivallaceae bacterium]